MPIAVVRQLGLIALALLMAMGRPAPAATLTYGCESKLTPAESSIIEASLLGGWDLFCGVVGKRDAPPELVPTRYAQARVAIVRGGDFSQLAQVTWYEGEDQPYIFVSLDKLLLYSPLARSRVMAHEFLHFYYGLPDHYFSTQIHHPHCVMDNFHVYGWTGRLCADCRSTVAKYYEINAK